MELNQKIRELEAELKLLKNEVKEVLLDIRETVLNHENPFTSVGPPAPKDVGTGQEPPRQEVVAQQEEPVARVEKLDEREEPEARGG